MMDASPIFRGPLADAEPGIVVSIVTPSMNSVSLIEETICSVRAQSYRYLEHIVVDGRSTDGTLDVLRQHEGTYALRWLSEPDHGMYDAVNKGLRLATGDILTYLNSDDLLFPWAIEVVVRAFQDDPGADLVFGDALRFYEEIDAIDLVLQAPFRFGRIARTGSLVQPSVFWRRRLLAEVGEFDDSLRLAADLDYWLRAGRIANIRQIEEVLSIERVHAGGQSSRLRRAHSVEGAEVRGRYHRDGRLRLARKLTARLLNGVASRRRMIRFAWAIARRNEPAWDRFRQATKPRIRFPQFLIALVSPRPLSGTPAKSLEMKLLRGRWLELSRRGVLPPPSQPSGPPADR